MAKRSDEVTLAECDWSFLDIPEVVAALGEAARRVALIHPASEIEDAKQEAYLYLAASPALVGRYLEQGEVGNLAFRFYSKMCERIRDDRYYSTFEGGH